MYLLYQFFNIGCNQPLLIIVDVPNIKYIVLIDIEYVSSTILNWFIMFYMTITNLFRCLQYQ